MEPNPNSEILESRRKPARISAGTLGCIVVLLVVAASVIGWVWSIVGPFTEEPQPVDLATISSLTGMQFPPSAQVVSSSYSGVIRSYVTAEVRLSREQLEDFFRAQTPAVERWDNYPSPPAEPDSSAEVEEKWGESGDHMSDGDDQAWHFSTVPPKHHPKPPYQDLIVVDVLVTSEPNGGVVVSIIGGGS